MKYPSIVKPFRPAAKVCDQLLLLKQSFGSIPVVLCTFGLVFVLCSCSPKDSDQAAPPESKTTTTVTTTTTPAAPSNPDPATAPATDPAAAPAPANGNSLISNLTQGNLNRIQNDMSPTDVEAIFGQPTNSKTEPIPIVGGTQTTYYYQSGNSSVTIVFKNNQVKSKTGVFNP